MTTLRERIGNERRRLRNVRQRMAAAIAVQARGNEAFVPFYIAVADYIEATMQRLHDQDVKMGEMLVEKAGADDDRIGRALEELNERLGGANAHLQPFLAARDALREHGAAALEDFERVAQTYSDYIVANMGHHGATNDMAGKLFTPADWEYMAGAGEEQTARERQLFDQVVATVPEGIAEPTD